MLRKHLLAVSIAVLSSVALGQQSVSGSQPDPSEKGFVSFVEFGGSFNSAGHVLKLDTSAGYNVSRHVGIDFGVPFYFVGRSSTNTAGTKTSFSAAGMGAPYADVRLTFNNPKVSYNTSMTVFLPYGDKDSGLSTGQTSFDWNNHFERSFGRVTPFGEAGVGNTVADTSTFKRPYSSHGYNAHFEGGAMFDAVDKVSIGGSFYNISPWGAQTIYSRSLPRNSGAAVNVHANGNAASQRVFDQNSVTSGDSSLGKDHGLSTWVDIAPAPYAIMEFGYTRSISFALDTVSFGLRFNLAYLAKNRR